jgi:hypothetical protein
VLNIYLIEPPPYRQVMHRCTVQRSQLHAIVNDGGRLMHANKVRVAISDGENALAVVKAEVAGQLD